ncbi:MAG: peptidase M4, partial [Acidobacteria bacterium]|nr:peptidase M4 [Acidobacteriota bacterium]
QTVFTCLSHDIIVHETTHAVLDGIRTYFSERTNPDVPAFHEAFADIAALFRHFSHKEALLDTIQKTGGRLYQYHLKPDVGITDNEEARLQGQLPVDNPLVGLAQQFGEARGTGRALRSALSDLPDPKLIKEPNLEPHERGAILVSAVFDAYFTIYLRRTADLFRVYRAGGGNSESFELSGAMANLLADAASSTAEDLFQICVRAIDYCPPVDITFGDYLRAIMTAHRDFYPTDKEGVRDAFMQAFRLRGIVPEDAQYFSEDSLCWPLVPRKVLPDVDGLIFGDPNGLTRDEKDRNGDVLRAYAKKNAALLGFLPDRFISVPAFHPAFRVAPDGSLRIDMVVEMSQTYDALFDSRKPELGTFPMRGGVTLLIAKPSLDKDEYPPGEIRYVIQKRLGGNHGQKREERQRRFSRREGLLNGDDPKRFQLDFNMLHGGF